MVVANKKYKVMSENGGCLDNAVAESFFCFVKKRICLSRGLQTWGEGDPIQQVERMDETADVLVGCGVTLVESNQV